MGRNKVCHQFLKLISRTNFETRQKILPIVSSACVRPISTCRGNYKLHHNQPRVVSSPQHAELFVASLRKADRTILEEALKKYNSGHTGKAIYRALDQRMRQSVYCKFGQ